MKKFFFLDCIYPHQSFLIILKFLVTFIILDNSSHFITFIYCFFLTIVDSVTLPKSIINNYLS